MTRTSRLPVPREPVLVVNRAYFCTPQVRKSRWSRRCLGTRHRHRRGLRRRLCHDLRRRVLATTVLRVRPPFPTATVLRLGRLSCDIRRSAASNSMTLPSRWVLRLQYLSLKGQVGFTREHGKLLYLTRLQGRVCSDARTTVN